MGKFVTDSNNEWTPELLEEAWKHIEEIGVGEMGLELYENQFEIVGSDGMLEAYASVGLPINYQHWSFGKKLLTDTARYKRGHQGLAYELVINSSPCINYLMEENTLTTQMLVMAHAGVGHNAVFKGNEHFREWTMADYIVPYMKFAKAYIAECETKYGWQKVEQVLDAAHALQNYSVDKYKKPHKPKGAAAAAQKAKHEFDEQTYDQYINSWTEYANRKEENKEVEIKDVEPTENILYFIEKNAPNLKQWEREVVRIVRMIGQYFFPQLSCQVTHEGVATFTHHHIVSRLDEKGIVDSAFMMEFAQMHAGVVWQRDMHPLHNPYKLGWEIFKDIKRMCETPTKEDELWFPHLVGKPFWPEFRHAFKNFKDTSLIQQYVSPKLIRDFKLMALHDGGDQVDHYDVTEVSDEVGYGKIRKMMADSKDINLRLPRIEVADVLSKGDRRLILKHHMNGNIELDREEAAKTLKLVYRLWQFPVEIQSFKKNEDGTETYKGSITFKPEKSED